MGKVKPHFVTRQTGTNMIDPNYIDWLNSIKQQFRSSQAKAAVRVNESLLSFYWSLGRDIVSMHADSKWGSSFFDTLSLDLRAEFPNQKGFSVTNLKYVKRWYLFYCNHLKNRQGDFDDSLKSMVEQLSLIHI